MDRQKSFDVIPVLPQAEPGIHFEVAPFTTTGWIPAFAGTTALRRHGFNLRRRVPGPGSRPCNGFTLLEVLAAIALLAIAFATGLGALGKSAQNAAQAAALDTAVEHAQSLLAGQGLASPLKDGDLSGKFDDGMAWTLGVRAMPRPEQAGAAGAPPLQPGAFGAATIELFRLDVSVEYGAGRTLRLSTERAQAAARQQP